MDSMKIELIIWPVVYDNYGKLYYNYLHFSKGSQWTRIDCEEEEYVDTGTYGPGSPYMDEKDIKL